MAITNQTGTGASLPDWAKTHNLRISFHYSGPSEVGKAIMSYWWQRAEFSLEYLHRRIREYDVNQAEIMQAAGANAGCLVWSTGWSLANDAYHWQLVRQRLAEYKERGMHCLVYISLTNCFWKEMFETEPDCKDWRQVAHDGGFVPYGAIPYSGEITRYLMCVNNPNWRAYQKTRVKAALEAGADGFFWDNNFSRCHCDICQDKFRAFTKQRLGEAHDLPEPLKAEPPSKEDLLRAREVVFDWVPLSHPKARVYLAMNQFRYLSLLDILTELRAFAESIRPDVIWSNNGHLCHSIYDSANMPLSEDNLDIGYDAATGVLKTNAGILRYLYEECGRDSTVIMTSSHPENFAYGCTSTGMRDPELSAFLESNARLFESPQSPARVAVVCAEMNYIRSRMRWFDNLARHNLLFDAIPVHRLEKFDLDLYDVVVLRSILFLSDAECERLRQFVAAGGTLIATNDSSLYDENWAKRDDYGLADVFGVSAGKADKPRRVENSFGKGVSIFYGGAVEVEVEEEPVGETAEGIARDVREHVTDPIIEVDAPGGVVVTAMLTADALVLHVINYADAPAEGVRIRVTAGDHPHSAVREVVGLGGEAPAATDIDATDGLAFTLGKVDRYVVVAVE